MDDDPTEIPHSNFRNRLKPPGKIALNPEADFAENYLTGVENSVNEVLFNSAISLEQKFDQMGGN